MAKGVRIGSRGLQHNSVMPSQYSSLHTTSADEQLPDISRLRPELQRQWDHGKNAHLGNIVITLGSNKKVWWTCDCCPLGLPHIWESSVANRAGSQQQGCPFCASRAVCPHNSLPDNDPAVAAQWSENNPDSPECYTVKSNAKKLWRCEQCKFEWAASIVSRTSLSRGCPNCFRIREKGRQKQRQPPVTKSQHAMTYWDWEENEQAGLSPSKLTCCSARKAHWICPKCPRGQPHRWDRPILALAYKSRGSGCPCCSGRKACICNSLQSLHPDIAAEWDYDRNEATPADYAAQSNKKVWWYNSKRGSFQSTIGNRTASKHKRVTNTP